MSIGPRASRHASSPPSAAEAVSTPAMKRTAARFIRQSPLPHRVPLDRSPLPLDYLIPPGTPKTLPAASGTRSLPQRQTRCIGAGFDPTMLPCHFRGTAP